MDRNNNYLEYELKLLTKYSGANGLKVIEFRVPELKSLMRFWWRAFNDFKSIQVMKDVEGILFGSTEEHKAPISFKVRTIESAYSNSKKEDMNMMTVKLYMKIRCNCRLNKTLGANYIAFYDNLLRLSLIMGGLGKNVRKAEGVFYISTDLRSYNIEKLFQYIETIKVSKMKNQAKFIEHDRYYRYKMDCKLKHAWAKEIIIGKESINKKLLYRKVNQARITGRKNVIGANRKSNILNPVYITCYGSGNNVFPIITMLNQEKCKYNIDEYFEIQKEEIICKKG